MNKPRSSLILTISRRQFSEWGLKDGAKVPVTCGHLHGVAEVQQVDEDEDTTSLRWWGGRMHWQRYGLPGHVIQEADGSIRIGPLIGIMTTGLRDDPERPVGGRTGLLGDFVRAAREMNALCYLFNAADVDWNARTVRGCTIVGAPGHEVWRMETFPLPEVVYNRVPHRSAENWPDVRLCKREFRERNIPLFNERFLNKREMYTWLLRDSNTRELIPATERFASSIALEDFCMRHSLVYLKPTGGSLGMGILRVQRRPDHYAVRHRRNKQHITSRFTRSDALYHFVKQNHHGRTYLMQQGIRLMKYKGCSTDFRVHLHKDGTGHWTAAGIGAKVAGRGAVTTHVHNGGYVVAGEDVLRAWYGSDAPHMRQKLVDSAVRVAESLEGLLQGPVGEWGLDAGIDVNGRVWVFESNAKPGRAIFKHPDLREAGRRSARMVVEYAAWLAQYPLRRGVVG